MHYFNGYFVMQHYVLFVNGAKKLVNNSISFEDFVMHYFNGYFVMQHYVSGAKKLVNNISFEDFVMHYFSCAKN